MPNFAQRIFGDRREAARISLLGLNEAREHEGRRVSIFAVGGGMNVAEGRAVGEQPIADFGRRVGGAVQKERPRDRTSANAPLAVTVATRSRSHQSPHPLVFEAARARPGAVTVFLL